eukprot:13507610-Ditylum_brightwellii.AAC.1
MKEPHVLPVVVMITQSSYGMQRTRLSWGHYMDILVLYCHLLYLSMMALHVLPVVVMRTQSSYGIQRTSVSWGHYKDILV